MKLTNKILKTLREGTVSSSMGDDDTTTVVASSNNLTKTLKDVETSKTQGGGDVEVEVIDETENITEALDGSAVVQYDSERSGEDPFTMNGIKWQYVNAIYPDGKKDIAVYRFDHDLAYDYAWFRKTFIDRTNEGVNLGDDYESSSRGGDAGEVGDEDYEEQEKLKQQVAMEEGKGLSLSSTCKPPIKEAVAKMTKGDLERLVETKAKPKKRIIKVGSLKKK